MNNGIYLTTDRLLLREFQAADWKTVHEWDADPDVVRYLTWDCEHTETAARERVLQQIAQVDQKPRLDYDFVITLQETKRPIGAIDLHLREDQRSAWVAYRLYPAFRARGYATEALRCMLKFGFESLRLHRIKATVNRANIASCRVLAKRGMRYEGVERTWDWQDDPVDEAQYALLDREWTSHRTEEAFVPKMRRAEAKPHMTTRRSPGAGARLVGQRTANLVLRAFEEDDWELFHTARFHPVTVSPHHLLSRTTGLGEHEARDYVAETIRRWNEQPRVHMAFVVVGSEAQRSIGAISLDVSQDHRLGWIDYHLHPDFLRTDDAEGAVQELMRFGFIQAALHRIGADCWADDAIAMQILEQAGLAQEACYLDVTQRDGTWQSFLSYAAFQEDYV